MKKMDFHENILYIPTVLSKFTETRLTERSEDDSIAGPDHGLNLE
jgi:hypothetical protein